MKSGTTTLFAHLSNHTGIYLSPNKEPGYFSRDERFERGAKWYLDLFKLANPQQITGEASTCYSRWPHFDKAIERIHAVSPNAKFIFIMRDPVYRTYSHYKHRMSEFIVDGKEVISFENAIENDAEMMCASDYALQISKYLEVFDREQFYFTTLDLLIEQPQIVMQELFSFLGLKEEDLMKPTADVHENKVGNKISHRRNLAAIDELKNKPYIQAIKSAIPFALRTRLKSGLLRILKLSSSFKASDADLNQASKLSTDQIEYLRHHFSDSIAKTERITGLDLMHWKEAPSDANG